MNPITSIKTRIPDETVTDELCMALYEDACSLAMGYMARDTVPKACENAVIRLAVVLYNRMGMEGEQSRSEGGVSSSVAFMPEDIKAQLRPYRLAYTGVV